MIENDQILVLARGKLVENGHPHDLLVKYFGEPSEEGQSPIDNDTTKGIKPPRHSLASLVKQTGGEMSLKLRRMAMLAKRRQERHIVSLCMNTIICLYLLPHLVGFTKSSFST